MEKLDLFIAPNEDERLMAGNHCVIRTKSKAKLPIHEGVQWQYLDSGWKDIRKNMWIAHI